MLIILFEKMYQFDPMVKKEWNEVYPYFLYVFQILDFYTRVFLFFSFSLFTCKKSIFSV